MSMKGMRQVMVLMPIVEAEYIERYISDNNILNYQGTLLSVNQACYSMIKSWLIQQKIESESLVSDNSNQRLKHQIKEEEEDGKPNIRQDSTRD